MKSEVLSSKELRMYKTQISLPYVGLKGQERIKKMKVLVAGAGGKGACVLQDLSSSGIGFIGICDNQIVEESVLYRQSLYGYSDLGKQKAIVSKQRLLENNPLTRFEIHNINLTDLNIGSIISSYDIIVDATDNLPAHLLIEEAAQKANKPVVSGTVNNSGGIVCLFNCDGNQSIRSFYKSFTLQQPADPLFTEFPGEGNVYPFIGSIMAREVFKLILSLPSVLKTKILQFDLAAYNFSFLEL